MADSDKNILITPNNGSTNDPKIEFTGFDNNTVSLNILDDGTLSFEGSSGQLFSITDSLTGTIFSVNDVSGIPSIEVDDDGTIRLAEFGGNVLIGTAVDDGTNLLQVDGSMTIAGTTFFGTATLTADSQNDVVLFSADGNAAQSGAFHNKLIIKGGSSQTRDLQLYQQDNGYAWLDTSYASNSLNISSSFTALNVNTDLTVTGTITNQNDAITKARMMGWVPAYSNSTESTVKWDTAEDAVALGPVGSGGMAYKAIRMKSGQTVRIAMQMKGSTADTDGVYIRIYFYNGDLPDGKTHVSNNATYTLVQEDTSGDTSWKENGSITTSYVGYERTYTASADGYMSIVVLNWSGYAGTLYCKQPDIQFEPPTGGATISDKSDNVNYNVIFTNETSGSQTLAGIDTGTFTFNPSTGTLKAPEVQATSDETLKTNIITIPAPLEKLEAIRGVNFNWKENNRYAMGVIAQEVEKVIPEAVGIDENGIRSVNYASLVGLLIEAVKTLSDRIDHLEGK